MILTIHVDNRIITLAGYDGEKQTTFSSVGTDPLATADQLAAAMHTVLFFRGMDMDAIEGAVISSVVPSLTHTLQRAVERLTDGKVLVVGAGMRTGLNLRVDSAGMVGSDFIATAVGALHEFAPPLVIINMVGATTFSAIDQNGVLIGRSILPGVESTLEHLCRSSAQLPLVSFDVHAPVIGRGTVDAIKSGALYGALSMLDGMTERYLGQLGENANVVATGGIASVLAPLCRYPVHYRPYLLHDGLRILYQKNR
mgnify:CR=1 FL=1